MSDIEKVAVFDERIVQSRPVFAVEKGAVSLTNVPFSAIAQNAGQQTFQIQCPSENVYVDRAVEWTSTCYLQFVVTKAGGVGTDLAVLASDVALSAFPLHTLVQTMSATINDTTVTMNTSDVLREVLRLTDSQKNRTQRTCPTYPDVYQNYNDAFGTISNPLGGYAETSSPAEVKNGAYYNVEFVKPDGSTLDATGYASPLGTAAEVKGDASKAEVKVANTATAKEYVLYLKFTSTEKLVLSPFVFSDVHSGDTGLFGIQNIQLIMNMSKPSFTGLNGRVLRVQQSFGSAAAYSGLDYYTPTGTGFTSPFNGSVVNVQFLTPSLDLPLPPRSIVPYMEFPRYVTSVALSETLTTGKSASGVMSQTITLPSIPDLLIIYAKPQSYAVTEADWYLPITKLSVNFDNFSGLLSSHSASELYQMSVANGLVMDYNQWIGQCVNGSTNATGKVPLTGGFLVLKPSKDITLQSGQAPSLVGNFTFQFNCSVVNNTSNSLSNINLWVITANSGFFESVKGSSRIVKGVLDERSIIAAPPADVGRSSIDRMVGGAKMKNMMGNALGKVRNLFGVKGSPAAAPMPMESPMPGSNKLSKRLK
jgi:hypothetical protein